MFVNPMECCWKMEVDRTCIVVSQGQLGVLKFDFWPIFPANCKLKPVECEDGGKEILAKAKKRAKYGQDKKTRVERK